MTRKTPRAASHTPSTNQEPKSVMTIEERLQPVAFKASRAEIDRWKKKAIAEDRTLSHWIRRQLNAGDAREAAQS